MGLLLVLEERIFGVRQATTLGQGPDDINRVGIFFTGLRGYINRSGAILCRDIEAKKILESSEKVSELMTRLYPNDFKGLYHASSNNLDNPAKQDTRDKYYHH